MADDATTIDTTTASALPRGVIEFNGRQFMTDPRGAMVPMETIKPVDKLIDGEVRKILGFAQDLSAQVGRFRQHTLDDFDALAALLDQEYGAKAGGAKGNMTFTSFDGCMKVTLQVADNFVFGPELQTAKKLVDECLNSWTGDSGPELQAVVNQAFNVDKEGQVNRSELFRLLRLDIADERWRSAMQAIRDSMRVDGSKRYVRFYVRPNAQAGWSAVTIDVAVA